MELTFSTVGLIGRCSTQAAIDTLSAVNDLLKTHRITVHVDEQTADAVSLPDTCRTPRHDLGRQCELVIVVGGDGSILDAARSLVDHDVPVLGINRGRLGFLTDVHPHNLRAELEAVLRGEYTIEKRFLLHTEVHSGKTITHSSTALNDVVLFAGDQARMIEFELAIDQQFVYSQRSDGLIISTPTGSTAYALSCGGPVLHPSLDAIVVVPMSPHTLTSRPIVIASHSTLELSLALTADRQPQLSCDGQAQHSLKNDDIIRVRRHKKMLRLIHPNGHNFYQVLRNKLHWGVKLSYNSTMERG